MLPSRSSNHLSRRSLLKGLLTTAGGLAVGNWGALTHSQTIAQEARRSGKRCIMLYMEGGVSQIDTFDMKPGRPTGGEFRPISTNVGGIQVCEYLPIIARYADKLAIIRSMRTQSVDHGIGGYHMHTCYPSSQRFPHPEIGAMTAKYCENPESDLPSFVKIGSTSGIYGAGYLDPQYEPCVVGHDGRLPPFRQFGSIPAGPGASRRVAQLHGTAICRGARRGSVRRSPRASRRPNGRVAARQGIIDALQAGWVDRASDRLHAHIESHKKRIQQQEA